METFLSPAQQRLSSNGETPPSPEDGPPIPSAFLALPLEIRRTIYYYALLPSPEHRQVLRPFRAKYPNSWWGTEDISRILRVSKQLYHEAEEVLYSSFEFPFQDTTPYQVERFLKSVSPRARSSIRQVCCCVTMNGQVRDSIRRSYIDNWKACLEVLCVQIPRLRKVALQIRFLDGRSLRTTFVESILDLASKFNDDDREISLLPYDSSTSVDRQGVAIVEECGSRISQRC